MSHRVLAALTVGGIVGLATVVASPDAAAAGPAGGRHEPVRINHMQTVATHNSYHRELSRAEKKVQRQVDPGARNLFYSHSSLTDQFDEQHVRSIELDVLPDPEGGLYRHPLVRKLAGLGPLTDPEWSEPGTKVFHIVDADYGTTCITLVSCLSELKAWSDQHPTHVPFMILVEFKASEDRFEEAGGVTSPPWSEPLFQTIESEIRSTFGDDRIITPDDVRRRGLTLEQSVLQYGWPTLNRSRGKVMFMMDNTNEVRDLYREGRPNLEGRVMFTDSVPGASDAAFMKRNDPLGEHTAEITDLVDQGYLVRTRADIPIGTVESGDTTMRDAAMGSGAQIVSTDFPVAGMSTRYGTDYFVSLPGALVVQCNDVSAPPRCRDERLEQIE
jgi:hypothetical protein